MNYNQIGLRKILINSRSISLYCHHTAFFSGILRRIAMLVNYVVTSRGCHPLKAAFSKRISQFPHTRLFIAKLAFLKHLYEKYLNNT